MNMANLLSKHSLTTWFLFFLMNDIINHSSSARTLGNTTPINQNNHPNHHHPDHHHHHKITFYMQDVFNTNDTTRHTLSKPSSSSTSSETSSSHHLPFQKPIGLFPPTGGIPISDSDVLSPPVTGLTSQKVGVSNINVLFPARATLEELEIETMTTIDEDLFENSAEGDSIIVGKAQGVYVACSENGINNDHMVALISNFVHGELKDGLRFFGVIRVDGVQTESHVAVIGGTGKYDGANGYATIKFVKEKLLLFNVYLS